jgi:2-dehydropantoate 2-reductase
MKIAIVGCGAMGSVYAALLADAGHEIWAIDSWKEHVEAMRAKGLRLEGASGDRTVKLHATTDTTEAGPCDLVIIATKAMHVEQAATAAKALIGDNTMVLSIQNGLGGPDTTARVLGRDKVMVGVVGGFGASMRGPGHAHHNGWELVRLGTCTITGLTVGEVMNDVDAWQVASGCAVEAYNVAKARNIKVDIDDPVEYVRNFGSKIPNARPSMLLDHFIPPAAQSVDVAAPFNTVVSALVRNKERQMGVRE